MFADPPHARSSPLAVMVIEDDGTIVTSRGVAHYKSPFMAYQLSGFFAPARYRVVTITCSYSEVVLRTMNNYRVHYSLS
jgi:hypothetical protein